IRWLVGQGIHDIVLNLHHLPATITRTVGDGSDLNARVRYSWENPVLGSAGGPKRALPLLVDSVATTHGSRSANSGRFLIVKGDRLTDGQRTEIERTASLIRTAIWDDVRIGAGAELVDCVVCDGAAIPSGARYHRCAILPAGTREPRAGQRIEGTLLIAEI